jgi:hypothetical protein
MKQISLVESFQWARELIPILKQFESDGVSFYQVAASHADVRNRNGRIYTSRELQNSAASLSERPLNINHDPKRMLPFPENQVLAARYENGVVECIIQVADPKVQRQIESGEINHVSIEGLYLDDSKNTGDTEFPTSLHFRALALLTRDDEPGDPHAKILKDHHRALFLHGEIKERLCLKMLEEKKTLEAEWTTSYINNLDDDAFAYIEPGGKKDEEGKTVPRSIRHLPYKDTNGDVDLPHLRNALARLSQTSLPASAKSEARAKLVAAAKKAGIETSMDEALSRLSKATEDYRIAKQVAISILEDMDMDSEPDEDPLTNPQLKHPAVPSDPQDFDARSAVQLDPTLNNPRGQETEFPKTEFKVPQPKTAPVPENQQNYSANSAVKLQPTSQSPPDQTTESPKMNHPPELNPLAITNQPMNDKIVVTSGSAPNLFTALKRATTNVIVAPSIEEKANPKVAKKTIKVIVKK